jgi:hypothetical protein
MGRGKLLHLHHFCATSRLLRARVRHREAQSETALPAHWDRRAAHPKARAVPTGRFKSAIPTRRGLVIHKFSHPGASGRLGSTVRKSNPLDTGAFCRALDGLLKGGGQIKNHSTH